MANFRLSVGRCCCDGGGGEDPVEICGFLLNSTETQAGNETAASRSFNVDPDMSDWSVLYAEGTWISTTSAQKFGMACSIGTVGTIGVNMDTSLAGAPREISFYGFGGSSLELGQVNPNDLIRCEIVRNSQDQVTDDFTANVYINSVLRYTQNYTGSARDTHTLCTMGGSWSDTNFVPSTIQTVQDFTVDVS